MDADVQSTSLPVLEVVCPECDGVGSFKDADGRTDCWKCRGAGSLPTEEGAKIIRLMQSNLRRLLMDSGVA